MRIKTTKSHRNLTFEENLLKLDFLIQQRQKNVEGPTTETLVIVGLATKRRSHCHMARELIIANAGADAVIILRAAYESTILALYLQEHRGQIATYITFSELTSLRNMMELVEELKKDGSPFPGEEEQLCYIENKRNRIVESGLLPKFKLTLDDLKNLQRIKTYTNRAHFLKFEDIRNGITKCAENVDLFETGFLVYNLGSQMTHSNFDMVKLMVYFDKTHPLYSEHAMYRQILCLQRNNAQILHACGYLSSANATEIAEFALTIAKQFCQGH
ncbi:MAG: hypothetical protein IPJ49_14115 [Candidatus Obscuribacter sp.]|jgi:hypothetical protein|nr:hypothetical protein [Candidatus Obscuribacter sp.]